MKTPEDATTTTGSQQANVAGPADFIKPTLIPSKGILSGSVSFAGRVFGSRRSKAKESRVSFYFPTASSAGNPAPVSMPHGLGKEPTSYTVVSSHRDPAAGAPGTVFSRYPWATRTRITLQCSTAQTWVEVIIR